MTTAVRCRLDHQETRRVLGLGPVLESGLDTAVQDREGFEIREQLLRLVALNLAVLNGLAIQV